MKYSYMTPELAQKANCLKTLIELAEMYFRACEIRDVKLADKSELQIAYAKYITTYKEGRNIPNTFNSKAYFLVIKEYIQFIKYITKDPNMFAEIEDLRLIQSELADRVLSGAENKPNDLSDPSNLLQFKINIQKLEENYIDITKVYYKSLIKIETYISKESTNAQQDKKELTECLSVLIRCLLSLRRYYIKNMINAISQDLLHTEQQDQYKEDVSGYIEIEDSTLTLLESLEKKQNTANQGIATLINEMNTLQEQLKQPPKKTKERIEIEVLSSIQTEREKKQQLLLPEHIAKHENKIRKEPEKTHQDLKLEKSIKAIQSFNIYEGGEITKGRYHVARLLDKLVTHMTTPGKYICTFLGNEIEPNIKKSARFPFWNEAKTLFKKKTPNKTSLSVINKIQTFEELEKLIHRHKEELENPPTTKKIDHLKTTRYDINLVLETETVMERCKNLMSTSTDEQANTLLISMHNYVRAISIIVEGPVVSNIQIDELPEHMQLSVASIIRGVETFDAAFRELELTKKLLQIESVTPLQEKPRINAR